MDKFLNSCDTEYMKMAMLKQEEIFREQVYELHRLYGVQKILMKNIPNIRGNEQNENRWIDFHNYNTKSHYIYQQARQSLDLEQPAEEHITKFDGDCVTMEDDQCDIELTLGPSSYNPTRKVKTPLTSDSGLSFSSSSTGSSQVKRKHNSDREKMKDGSKAPNLSPSFLNSRRNSTCESNDQMRQARVQQPPWLFQVLSMNIS